MKFYSFLNSAITRVAIPPAAKARMLFPQFERKNDVVAPLSFPIARQPSFTEKTPTSSSGRQETKQALPTSTRGSASDATPKSQNSYSATHSQPRLPTPEHKLSEQYTKK